MAENTVHYYYDSYDDEDPEETMEMKSGERKSSEQREEIRVRHNEARSGSVMKIIFVSVLAVALLGSVIYSLDKRNTMYNKVSALNDQLSLAEAENVRLQSELDSKMSAKNIEEYAENVLGMQKVVSSQITYIKIQTDDVVNIPQQEQGFTAKIKAFFDRCVEYFRG